jgi:uncharacterized protein YdaU (DUF1376 family)
MHRNGKLLAEWFWADRWIGSRGFRLPMEARGVYREMLTQAWLNGGFLPNCYEEIRKIIRAKSGEMRRSWPLVEPFWRVEGDRLVNDTQLEIYAESARRAALASARGSTAARARWNHAQAMHKHSRR